MANSISDFITQFKEANFNVSDKTAFGVAGNNIKLIDTILKAVMGGDEYTDLETALLLSTTNKPTIASTNPPLPSYNVKVPHVEVWVNGVLIIKPGQQDEPDIPIVHRSSDNDKDPNILIKPKLDVWFKDCSLDMAFGGPLGTITGTLNLFSRDPLDFLSFLYDFTSNIDELSGLPEVSLKFGWNIAHPDSPTNPTTLLSPKLDFLVTNVGMEDPGSNQQGSIFTLKLQDIGSTAYDNCAADFAIKEDYPQEQLRVLLERVMGIRLFTLDDLLSMNASGDSKQSVNMSSYSYESLDPNNPSQRVILTTLLERLQTKEKEKTGDIKTSAREAKGIVLPSNAAPETSETVSFVTNESLDYFSESSLKDLTNLLKITSTPSSVTFTTPTATENKGFLSDDTVYAWVTGVETTWSGYMSSAYDPRFPFQSHHYMLWQTSYDNATAYRGDVITYMPGLNGVNRPLLAPDITYSDAIKDLYNWIGSIGMTASDLKAARRGILVTAATAAIRAYGDNVPVTANLKADVIKIFNMSGQKTPAQVLKEILDNYNRTDPTGVSSTLSTIYSENPSMFTSTFFLNGRNPPVRLNSSSFREVIISLVNRIQCRWYPITNGTLEQNIADSANAAQDSYVKYNAWKRAVANKDPNIATLKAEYEKAKIKKAYGCRLIYVSSFPKNYRTTSNTTYIKNEDVTDGAFVLLPNVNPLNVTSDEMPLIYGPGGSSYPYLFGGAQNIKQVLLDKANKLPMLFGEVLDAKVNYNNLTALIKANFNENAAITEAGTRISLNNTMKSDATIKSTKEQKKADRDARKRVFESQFKRLYPNLINPDGTIMSVEQVNAYITKKFDDKETGLRAKYRKEGNFKSYATAIRGRTPNVRADQSNTIPALDKTYNAPLDPVNSARDFLSQRLGNLIYSPTSVSLQVPGDPFLIRQGVGAFELLHYFLDKTGIGVRYNYLLSGVFLVTSINHNFTAGNYTTNIKGFKIPPVENTFTNTIDTWRKSVSKEGEAISEEAAALNVLMTENINLENIDIITDANSPISSATRIVNGTIMNTNIPDQAILNKFYFNLPNN